MSSKTYTPVTCKQLASIDLSNPLPHIGFQEVNTVVLVAFVTACDEDGARLTIDVEDSTSQIVGLVVFDYVVKPEPFEYYEFILTLSISENNVNFFVSHLRPITDHNQITSHLLTAYSNHLRCAIRQIPAPTHRQHLQMKQQSAVAHSDGGASSYTTAFTGINFQQNAMQGQNNVSQGSRHQFGDASADPQTRVFQFLQSQSDTTEGFTIHQISQGLGIPPQLCAQIIDKLQEDGQAFTASDEYHFSAL